MNQLTIRDYDNIILHDVPMIDVRSPIEYQKGSFLNTVNLPILSEEERHLIGICYQENGQEQATALGHLLVSGDRKEKRINAWKQHLELFPDSILFCFRGGQRSSISQQWIKEYAGKDIIKLEGGYKDFRNYLIKELHPLKQKSVPIILGGLTGSGKTELLNKLHYSIDLEGIANHRGSSFGGRLTKQPTQINFENNLAFALIKHRYQGHRYMILEDEGKNIGSCFLPVLLEYFFNSHEMVILETSFEERVNRVFDEYVLKAQNQYHRLYQENGFLEWASNIQQGLERIKRRLGGTRYSLIMTRFQSAVSKQQSEGDSLPHKGWIELLLRNYYDPMYLFQLEKEKERIIYRGSQEDVLNYLSTKSLLYP